MKKYDISRTIHNLNTFVLILLLHAKKSCEKLNETYKNFTFDVFEKSNQKERKIAEKSNRLLLLLLLLFITASTTTTTTISRALKIYILKKCKK